MKILKIALQNINSLKSQVPIIIDFEGEAFQDVGLFAITGPTGAGKTTILDAIMIALYHKIPRLNVSGTAALEMAISHGATEAFVSLDFENNGTRYQSHWDVVTTTKTGKIKKNPTHNFSFKNLTTGDTIASDKKTAVLEAIEEVVTLSSEQFLRSVLLAQGEFAAFLNAKGTEKAKLLEQITGEEIYNQIGRKTQERKVFEEKELEKITNKINLDELISPEQMLVLKDEETTLKSENKAKSQLQKRYIEIKNWYKNQEVLVAKQEQVKQEQLAFEIKKEEAKKRLEQLVKNQAAEPFRLLISQSQENSQAIKNQEELIKQSKLDLDKAHRLLNEQDVEVQKAFSKKQDVQAEFVKWQPVLEELTKIENEVSVSLSHQKEKKNQLAHLNQTIQKIEQQLEVNHSKETRLANELKLINQFLISKKNTPAVEKHFSDWKVKLTQLKEKKEAHTVELDKQKRLLSDIEKQSVSVAVLEKDYLESTKAAEATQTKFDDLSALLAKNNIKTLLTEKEKNHRLTTKWREFQNLSNEFARVQALLIEDKTAKTSIDEQQQKVEQEIVLLENKKVTQQQLLDNTITILEQQKLIKKYEKDRLLLKKGEPCFLCGSESHPFVTKYQEPQVSGLEVEVKQKTQNLEQTNQEFQELHKKLAVLTTKNETLTQLIAQATDQLEKLSVDAKAAGVTCQLTDKLLIETELNQLLNEETEISQKLEVNQQLQQQKEVAEVELKKVTQQERQKKEQLTNLTNSLVHLKESEKELGALIKKIETTVEQNEQLIAEALAPFKMKVPSPDRTDEILQSIEETIKKYKLKKEEGQELEKELSNLAVELHNAKQQHEELMQQKENLEQELLQLQEVLDQQVYKRNQLLSPDISVQDKRNDLEVLKKESDEHFLAIGKVKQELLQNQNKCATLLGTYQVRLDELESKKIKLNDEINELLSHSGFEDFLSVQSALLPLDEKEKLTRIKEALHNKSTELKALEKQIHEDVVNSQDSKDFEETAEEINQLLETIEQQVSQHNHRLGEISQLFAADTNLRNEHKELVIQKDKQQKIVTKWQTLYRLLGGTKDAFNTYVQRITLKNLLLLANLHLFKLNKRYELFMGKNYVTGKELDFAMIDRYHNDQKRAIDTASGGEKFLISLALALGLADLTSRNMTIDSLFIDEGFGTLDPDSLESAMHTLETLQAEGKLIGVISHVENLKERIPTQIQVSKKNNGVSEVFIAC